MDSDWNGLTGLIANLIAKHADALSLDSLPGPTPAKDQRMKDSSDKVKIQIEAD